jgi:hypothetical protein
LGPEPIGFSAIGLDVSKLLLVGQEATRHLAGQTLAILLQLPNSANGLLQLANLTETVEELLPLGPFELALRLLLSAGLG